MAERNAKLILMVGVLGVSASAILVRFSQAPSGVTAAYRLGWTVLLLLPVVLLRCRAELRRVTARDLVLCGASGVLLALHFLTWFESLKRTSVASSTVLVSTEVIFTALGFALFLHGKIPRLGVWAILLAFGGSALLALSGGGGAGGAVRQPAGPGCGLGRRRLYPHRTDTAGPSVYHGLHLSDLSGLLSHPAVGHRRGGDAPDGLRRPGVAHWSGVGGAVHSPGTQPV